MSKLEKLLTTEETAKALGLSHRTLATWRSTGRTELPFIKIGGAVRYRATDVEAWLQGAPCQSAPRAPARATDKPQSARVKNEATSILVAGEARPLLGFGPYTPLPGVMLSGTLIGLAWMGDNNAENNYGWTGIKCIVLAEHRLWVIDNPESAFFRGAELDGWTPEPLYAQHLPLGIIDARMRLHAGLPEGLNQPQKGGDQ